MALTTADYDVFVALMESGVLPAKPRILELGESNCYDSFDTNRLVEDILSRVEDAARRKEMLATLQEVSAGEGVFRYFDLAKLFFQMVFMYESLDSIDFHGTPAALKYDLNVPLPMDGPFDIVLNLGTAEHVFNIHQFFKTVHDMTRPGGLMLHEMPMQGWFDHGFYNFQPTFYFDLAAANGYEIAYLATVEINPPRVQRFTTPEEVLSLHQNQKMGPHVMLFAAFRKPEAAEFKIPMQGYYFGAPSEERKKAWVNAR